MKVILTEKINKLGNIGDTVEVKTGFARNYLLPNGKAMRFTRGPVRSEKGRIDRPPRSGEKISRGKC